MAAPKNNQNAKGNTGGKSKNDRELAARVRSLALGEIEKYLQGKEDGYQNTEMKHALLLKLASTVLPRLNEHTGDDGDPIEHKITGINYIIPDGNPPKAGTKTAPRVYSS